MVAKTESLPKLSRNFLTEVAAQFPAEFFSDDPVERENYGRDWTRVFPSAPSAVFFPRSTDDVAHFLKLCSQHKIAVVPSGGRTGLAGGAVAAHGEIVLSLTKMNRMDPVDSIAQTVHVQAGAVTEAVHQHCQSSGLTWPVDFASKGSSHIGGNIATNAGGVRVIRYGLTRHWVLGLQAVMMGGKVLELNGALEKNNTGLDLRQMLIGSEGTLAVITEATLKLTPLPDHVHVFFFALESVPAVLRLFAAARRGPFQIMTFEFLTLNCLKLVTEQMGRASPVGLVDPTYVLLEIEQRNGAAGAAMLDQWLEDLFQDGLVTQGTLAQSPRESKELWVLRESISECLAHQGFVHKNDIALPVAKLESFVAGLPEVFKHFPEFEIFVFGHIGDGNLHINTMKPPQVSKDDFLVLCQESDLALFEWVRQHRGSISAEHGIGLLKKAALGYTRSADEIELMKAVKQIFDPQGLLNPGKIFNLS